MALHVRLVFTSITVLSLILASPRTHAWGADGHRTVGAMAWRLVNQETREALSALFDGLDEQEFAEACLWPDQVRSRPEYEYTAPFHYVNLPRDAKAYDPARDCRDGACVVGAIGRYVEQLSDQALSQAQRRDAAKFVCHFVGDVHQPLHAGYGDDRGGNDHRLIFDGEPTNAHRMWDSLIIAGLLDGSDDWRGLPALVESSCKADEVSSPKRWAEESFALVVSHAYPEKETIEDSDLRQREPIVRQRLCQAAHRLAATLQAVLTE